MILAADWDRLGPTLGEAVVDTLVMVMVTMLLAGVLGLIVGVLLYTTRDGGILRNRPIYWLMNILVNFIRPIPFIIMIAMFAPLTLMVVGTTIGRNAAIFVMIIAATFAVARIVEQNLVAIDPGVIEAARATGATRWRIITTLLVPEALGPLILGYTFICIAVVDMSALAGTLDGGGLGAFALDYGYKRWNFGVVWVTVIVIIVLVQLAQALGNRLSRKAIHHS